MSGGAETIPRKWTLRLGMRERSEQRPLGEREDSIGSGFQGKRSFNARSSFRQ